MKYLSQFLKFAASDFLADKLLAVTGCRDWVDFDTKQKLGTKVDVVITEDATKYEQKDGKTGSNLYEKLTVKVAKDISLPVGAIVELVNPTCTVYGDFRNMLSATATDVKVLAPTQPAKG